MDNNRRAAFAALYEVEYKGAYSNIAAAGAIREYRADNEAFVRALVYGVLENRILLDHKLERFVRTGLRKVKPRALVLLRMGAYQIEFMNSIPDYAAINETVRIAKKVCRGLEGFINGVLRAYSAKYADIELPDKASDTAGYLSVKYSFSRDIAEMWIEMFGAEKAGSIMSASNEIPDLDICVNTLKNDINGLIGELETEGFAAEPAVISSPYEGLLRECALKVSGSGVISSRSFSSGRFFVQDTASMTAVRSLGPKPGDTVIDVCAAPGGKSFHAAIMMENTGNIIACDIYDHKLELIRKTADRLDITCIDAEKADARYPVERFIGRADIVIADAPCSGLGVVRRRPEIKLRRAETEELAGLQLEILENASSYVRPGGRLMYSTCTISNRENDEIAERFQNGSPDFHAVLKKQLLPDEDGCDGFYFCIFEREK